MCKAFLSRPLQLLFTCDNINRQQWNHFFSQAHDKAYPLSAPVLHDSNPPSTSPMVRSFWPPPGNRQGSIINLPMVTHQYLWWVFTPAGPNNSKSPSLRKLVALPRSRKEAWEIRLLWGNLEKRPCHKRAAKPPCLLQQTNYLLINSVPTNVCKGCQAAATFV